jgi:hypothetical protein
VASMAVNLTLPRWGTQPLEAATVAAVRSERHVLISVLDVSGW